MICWVRKLLSFMVALDPINTQPELKVVDAGVFAVASHGGDGTHLSNEVVVDAYLNIQLLEKRLAVLIYIEGEMRVGNARVGLRLTFGPLGTGEQELGKSVARINAIH